MADQADVEQALVERVAAALYPNGTAAPSVIGATCRIYRGWPAAAGLDADLAAGVVNVSVFPESSRHHRNTTRWPSEWQVLDPVGPGLVATVAGDTVTLSGDAAPGQLVGILVDGQPAVHRTGEAETAALVAAALADMIRILRPAVLSGTGLTLPGARTVVARVTADQPARQEVRRQSQVFRIVCWCPDPATRDAAAAAADLALVPLVFLDLADGTAGRVRGLRQETFDQSANAALYRRDLLYEVEYATTLSAMLPTMVFGDVTIAPAGVAPVASLFG